MFRLMEQRFELNGRLLRRRRESRGLTMKVFALRCGWSVGYQSRLEAGFMTVSEGTKNVIEQGLDSTCR